MMGRSMSLLVFASVIISLCQAADAPPPSSPPSGGLPPRHIAAIVVGTVLGSAVLGYAAYVHLTGQKPGGDKHHNLGSQSSFRLENVGVTSSA